MQYLPSKKIIFLMIGIVVIGSFLLVFRTNTSSENITENTDAPDLFLEKQAGDIDSDNDGLADWEEKLFGTNPKNPDSNGNGISDGEEFESIKKIAEIKPTDDVLNYLNQVGQALTNRDGSGNSVIPETLLEIPSDHYVPEDLTLVEADEVSITQYIARILLATKPYEESAEEETMGILERWLEVGEQDDLEALMSRSAQDKTLSNELARIPVPNELAPLHLEYINSMYNGGLSLEEIKLTKQNPQAGFFAAAKYANFQSRRSEAIIALTQYYNTYSLSLGTGDKN